MLKAVIRFSLGSLLAASLVQPALADHASDVQLVSKEMTKAAQALLATMQDKPSNIETTVGYNRHELAAMDYDNAARTNYVYWPYLRKGLPLDYMTADQRILDEVVTMYRPEISRSYLQQIDVNELRFVWFGGTEDGQPHYYRLEGADFWFEYDLVQGMGNHVHAVWRSKSGDFGGDLLMQHHKESH